MSSTEEQIQEMLKDPHCQDFIEAMATILVHQGHQPDHPEETTAKNHPLPIQDEQVHT